MDINYTLHHVPGQHLIFEDRKIIETFSKINKMLQVYYAHAYCAWEKGSVENANRHIRKLFSKGTNFIDVTKKQVEQVQNFIN